MMLCKWDNGVCVRCGTINRSGVADLRQNCRAASQALTGFGCPHLGDQTGEIKVQCETCQGQVVVQYPSHVCKAVRSGRCLPSFIPPDPSEWAKRKPESDIYRLCYGCELRPLEDQAEDHAGEGRPIENAEAAGEGQVAEVAETVEPEAE